jgi:HK97 family phage major capsid protein
VRGPLEAGTVSTGDPVFERVLFTPRSLACLVKCSVELLQDSVNIEDILTRAFTQSMAVEVDRVCLAGTGVAPQPLGIRNAPGVGEIAAVGAPTNYDVLVNLASLIWTKNTAPTAYIMSPREFATFGKLKEATTNAPLAIPPVIADIPRRMTTSVLTTEAPGTASTVFAGDFSQMLIGVRSSIRIDTLKERFSDTLEPGFIAWLRCDPQLVIPGAFARAIGVLPGTLLMAAEAEEPSPKAKK